ncbi:hypothetical protein OPV22_027927 [Ensete ventricosum]|uniref:Uncharacterized protein n=1 Tax=Ensete ventricosum TaxID=4639 RepID=A0AAV8PTA3_ENSVE|nr:hypothetical protein OPV22_027927 [Ensete ventricosum]
MATTSLFLPLSHGIASPPFADSHRDLSSSFLPPFSSSFRTGHETVCLDSAHIISGSVETCWVGSDVFGSIRLGCELERNEADGGLNSKGYRLLCQQ